MLKLMKGLLIYGKKQMKLNHSNIWRRILVEDYMDLDYFSYECDINIPRIIVSKTPEIAIQDFGDRVGITPFEMENEKQFNDLAINSIIRAWTMAGKTTSSFEEGKAVLNIQLDGESPVNSVLCSRQNWGLGLIDIIGHHFGGHVLMHSFNEIPKGELYLLPDPEFLGVIPIRPLKNEFETVTNELHGIGIINPTAIIKVIFGDL